MIVQFFNGWCMQTPRFILRQKKHYCSFATDPNILRQSKHVPQYHVVYKPSNDGNKIGIFDKYKKD